MHSVVASVRLQYPIAAFYESLSLVRMLSCKEIEPVCALLTRDRTEKVQAIEEFKGALNVVVTWSRGDAPSRSGPRSEADDSSSSQTRSHGEKKDFAPNAEQGHGNDYLVATWRCQGARLAQYLPLEYSRRTAVISESFFVFLIHYGDRAEPS